MHKMNNTRYNRAESAAKTQKRLTRTANTVDNELVEIISNRDQ